jgi:hypothetical protein
MRSGAVSRKRRGAAVLADCGTSLHFCCMTDDDSSTRSAVREARLRSAFASEYPDLVPGVWYIAATVASALRFSSERIGYPRLSDDHFEFRGGVTSRAAEARAARTA